MVQKKSIMIVDDHALFREGLRTIIERDPGFEVIGEAGNVHEAVKKARKLKPEMFLVDISLPDKNGFHLTRKICDLLPESHVMILSMHSKIDYISEAFQAGAKGYVVKESASERLLRGLETIAKGEYYLDSIVSTGIVENLLAYHNKKVKVTDVSYARLTGREQEVMKLLAEGLSRKKIAEKLFISPKTVENHRTSIMKKLNIHSTRELVRYATKIGLLDVDIWKG